MGLIILNCKVEIHSSRLLIWCEFENVSKLLSLSYDSDLIIILIQYFNN